MESHRNRNVSIKWAFVFALSACLVSSLASAQTEMEAKKSQWTYFYKHKPELGCFSTDIAAAEALIADFAAVNNLCEASFSQWATSRPNGVGITDQFNFCLPPDVPTPVNWAMQHWEDRTAKWTFRNLCSSSPTEVQSPVTRHFLYYCDDPNYSLDTPNNDFPRIPACRINAGATDPKKQTRGCCAKKGNTSVGDPIDVATGNMFDHETDYRGNDFSPLLFDRYYNSSGDGSGALGANWRHTYDRSIEHIPISASSIALAHRPDGRVLTFDNASGSWTSQPDIAVRLTRTSSPLGWVYTDESDTVETYDDTGRLLSIATRSGALTTLTYDTAGALTTVTDSHGRQLTFTYDTSGRIHVLTVPGGGTYVYGYDSANNLTSLAAPDTAVRTYVYNESANTSSANLPHALTGIVDENNDRFATWKYDATGRGIRSEHAGGADRVDIVYNGDGTSTVTDALGAVRTHTMIVTQAVKKLSSVSGVLCRDCGEAASYTYDLSGRLTEWRDARNTLFQRSYTSDGRNLVAGEWNGSGTSVAQNTTYTWHASYRVPLTITHANRRTTFTHDASGNVLTRTIADIGVAPNITRTWTYTYNSIGQVLTEDGPRTDVSDLTTFTYYNCATGAECGQVETITNALGHVTTYNTYNAQGQPLTITDPNGVVTTLTYDARQRLASRTVGSEQTTFEYWPSGLLKKATLADGSFLAYSYDAAHRLTSINDSEGNHVSYTLDARGNRTAEQLYDPSNALTQTRTRVFNSLNQLWKEIGAAGTSSVTTEFAYDNNNNLTSTAAPLGRTTLQSYDELDRLKQVTDPLLGLTKYSYDDLDQLISVTDPRNRVTTYTSNALGDLKEQGSPDTGTTTNTYDSGGNLATSTDARSKTGTYAYDALNRVTSVTYPDQTITYTYDSGTNQKGRLTQVTDASGSTSWTYDTRGRALSRQQSMGVTKTLGYAYDSAGRLQTLTLPSGNTVAYGYTDGKITSLTLNGSTTILSNVLYQPFGPTRGWTWGNSTLAIREYDTDGKVTDIDSAGLKTYSYDDAFRITGITDAANSSLSQSYGYDLLDRLTSASGTSLNQGWTYDANGNRLTQTGSAASTFTVSSTNNRLSSISGALTRSYSYDNTGNTTGDGSATFTYNDAGRMISATKASVTTTYALNALGQRVKKTATGSSRYFAYDEAGHPVGEYDNSGNLLQETVWFGDTPVATLRPNGAGVSLFYVHTDHLNAPRRISRPSDNVVVWRWDSDPFGTTGANEDPDGDSSLVAYNLRFPGQYFDVETGLHYNYYRDGYESATGRYTQSDPIGLRGGINTYAYASTNPVGAADPRGLDPLRRPVPSPARPSPEPGVRPMPQLPAPANEPSFRPRPGRALGLSLCVELPWVCVAGGLLVPSPIGEDFPEAANDPSFGDGDGECPPDCRQFRTLLNGMYQNILQLEKLRGMPEGTHIEWERFRRFVKSYEKLCGPYTPPPTIGEVYTK